MISFEVSKVGWNRRLTKELTKLNDAGCNSLAEYTFDKE